jgi:hypothetical protein
LQLSLLGMASVGFLLAAVALFFLGLSGSHWFVQLTGSCMAIGLVVGVPLFWLPGLSRVHAHQNKQRAQRAETDPPLVFELMRIRDDDKLEGGFITA